MKKKIIDALSVFFQAIDTILCRVHLMHPKIVVFIDGGICSQMLRYLHGQYFADYGLDVYYDINWYKVHGMDQFHQMPRTFELSEIWPSLPFKTLSQWQRKWYLLFFQARKVNGDMLPEPSSVKRSMYMYEYWEIPEDEHKRLFAKCYNINMSATPAIGRDTVFDNVVGIHVRRGDLAKGDNPAYGGVTDGYFLRAIELCDKEFYPKKYLFFSDEPDWVEKNICPRVKKPYEIIRGNKAWEDLWMLSHCPVIVASQGSFGKVAAQLNPKAVLIQCDNEYAIRDRINSYFIK